MIPDKEVISEELEFDAVERKFYDDLRARGQQVIQGLQESKGGLSRSYMCLLTMLLRLRQSISPQRYTNSSHGSCGFA
jgi:SNF2 family DNA or RNA helicase